MVARSHHKPPFPTGVAGVETMAKARAAAAAKRAANRALNLMGETDFSDAQYWHELARARGLRLPAWGQPVTVLAMKRWLKKIGLSVKDYLAWDGSRALGDFAARKPRWPLRAWAGLCLEIVEGPAVTS